MPDKGNRIAIRFGVTNQLGVQSNELFYGDNNAALNVETFKSEVDAIFGGQITKLSLVRYRMKESEKKAQLVYNPPRFTTSDVEITFGTMDEPTRIYKAYFVGLGKLTTDADVEDIVKTYCKTHSGGSIDRVYVGDFTKRA